jgi:hypothetical protein
MRKLLRNRLTRPTTSPPRAIAITPRPIRPSTRSYFGGSVRSSNGVSASALPGSWTAQQPDWKHHDAAYHPEYAVDRNSDNPERNQQDPHEGVQDQRQ